MIFRSLARGDLPALYQYPLPSERVRPLIRVSHRLEMGSRERRVVLQHGNIVPGAGDHSVPDVSSSSG